MGNGDKYLTDVGWGGWSISLPLKMEIGVPQSQPSGVYRLGRKDGLITVAKKKQRYLKTEGIGDTIPYMSCSLEIRIAHICVADGNYTRVGILT